MRTSAAHPLEDDRLDTLAPERPSSSAATLRIPDFDANSALYAATARLAGRMNAAAVSDLEHKSLLDERQRLLDKSFDGSIANRERNRLAYIRWSLDRIEDARYGHALDRLDDAVAAYERFSADLSDLHQQLTGITQRR
jgi:hypothetical protein